MTHGEQRIYLIKELLAEDERYKGISVPFDEQEQKNLLRSLMNVRMPKPISRDFLQVQDEYLQYERDERGITDGAKLPSIPRDSRLVLWQGDITTLKVDAIVNAANSRMLGCFQPLHSCIDNIVGTRSGIQLRLYCYDIMSKQGSEEPTGQAKLTPAFNLPSKYILHTVGPIIYGPVSEQDCEALASCYRSCLELAVGNDCRSIAFCCISTGEFHFPNEKAAEIAVQTVTSFLNAQKPDIRVIFNVFKDVDLHIYQKLLGVPDVNDVSGTEDAAEVYTLTTRVTEVMNDPVFGDYGRLIFPVDRSISDDLELQDVADILVWYNNVNPDRTVEIANYLRDHAAAGEQIFYDIYTDEEKAEDPAKENTGLFFFRGDPGEETAIISAGGGFEYVAAIHDSFPHALELSERGYNAFALIYRSGGADVACEDLARAIAFLHDNAEELQISMDHYSLWGGSAGARMSVRVSSYGTAAFGEEEYPAPAAVILQYTAISDLTGNEPPTYACVGTNDGIASYQSMQSRIERIQANGTDAEIEIFDGLEHGFGLGEGTIAEGWINNAISFWENHS